MRRLTIHTGDDHAEAAQFSNGVIAGYWMEAHQPYLWLNIDALREHLPDAQITWIDEETHA